MTERRLEILEAGLLTTVQDRGRPGWGAFGIPPSGALDDEALRLANALVGNPDGAAGLEITLLGPTLRATGDVAIAVVGGAFGPAPGRVLPLADGESVALRAQDPARASARAVVAVAGGLDVPVLLGSRSTCVVARFGGLHGWPLRRGDGLPVGPAARAPRAAAALEPLPWSGDVTLRTVPGPQASLFGAPACETFFGSAFRLLPESNRIGARLSGPAIRGDAAAIRDLPSEGTALGSVQITAEGQPIVLLNERPTTGGYPKIATVIAADLGLLVRARPGAAIRFARVTMEEARRLAAAREERIGRIVVGEGRP
jgi:antagonist of KipI